MCRCWRMLTTMPLLPLQRSQGCPPIYLLLTLRLYLAVVPSLAVVVRGILLVPQLGMELVPQLGMELVPQLLPTVVRWLGTCKVSRLRLVVLSSRW